MRLKFKTENKGLERKAALSMWFLENFPITLKTI